MQGFQSNISAMYEETRELRAALVTNQQQIANLVEITKPPAPDG
jgi:hypothetical protein